MNKRLKVLFVSNLFPNPQDAERGIFSLQLVKRLQEHCDIVVASPLPWFPNISFLSFMKQYYAFSQIPYQYDTEGVTTYSPKYPLIPKASDALHPLFMGLTLKKNIERLHAQYNFDLIHSRWLYPDSVAVDKIAKSLGLPHVATACGCDVNVHLFNPVEGPQIHNMLDKAEAITVVADDLKKKVLSKNIPEEKISTIVNGVDTSKFHLLDQGKCREQLGVKPDIKSCVFVGRLSSEKSVTTLVTAIANLNKQGKPIKLFLVGDGDERGALEAQAQSLNMGTDQIEFVGRVEHSAVATWLGSADIFCLPSLREGCPNVVLEALGSGTPIVASRVGAVPDLLSEETGLMANPGDSDSLTEALSAAYDKEWDRPLIAESSKQFSWEASAEKYLAAYAKAIAAA